MMHELNGASLAALVQNLHNPVIRTLLGTVVAGTVGIVFSPKGVKIGVNKLITRISHPELAGYNATAEDTCSGNTTSNSTVPNLSGQTVAEFLSAENITAYTDMPEIATILQNLTDTTSSESQNVQHVTTTAPMLPTITSGSLPYKSGQELHTANGAGVITGLLGMAAATAAVFAGRVLYKSMGDKQVTITLLNSQVRDLTTERNQLQLQKNQLEVDYYAALAEVVATQAQISALESRIEYHVQQTKNQQIDRWRELSHLDRRKDAELASLQQAQQQVIVQRDNLALLVDALTPQLTQAIKKYKQALEQARDASNNLQTTHTELVSTQQREAYLEQEKTTMSKQIQGFQAQVAELTMKEHVQGNLAGNRLLQLHEKDTQLEAIKNSAETALQEKDAELHAAHDKHDKLSTRLAALEHEMHAAVTKAYKNTDSRVKKVRDELLHEKEAAVTVIKKDIQDKHDQLMCEKDATIRDLHREKVNLENQIGQQKVQSADQTIKYTQISEELDGLKNVVAEKDGDLDQLLHDNSNIWENFNQLQSENDGLYTNLNTKDTELEHGKKTITELREANEKQLRDYQQQLSAKDTELEQNKKSIADLLAAKEKQILEHRQQLEDQAKNLEKRSKDAQEHHQSEVTELNNKLRDTEKQITELNDMLHDMKRNTETTHVSHLHNIAELNNKLRVSRKQASELNDALHKAEKDTKIASLRHQSEVAELNKSCRDVETKFGGFQERHQSEVAQLNNNIREAKEKFEHSEKYYQSEIARLNNNLRDANNKSIGLSQVIQSLGDDIARKDGEYAEFDAKLQDALKKLGNPEEETEQESQQPTETETVTVQDQAVEIEHREANPVEDACDVDEFEEANSIADNNTQESTVADINDAATIHHSSSVPEVDLLSEERSHPESDKVDSGAEEHVSDEHVDNNFSGDSNDRDDDSNVDGSSCITQQATTPNHPSHQNDPQERSDVASRDEEFSDNTAPASDAADITGDKLPEGATCENSSEHKDSVTDTAKDVSTNAVDDLPIGAEHAGTPIDKSDGLQVVPEQEEQPTGTKGVDTPANEVKAVIDTEVTQAKEEQHQDACHIDPGDGTMGTQHIGSPTDITTQGKVGSMDTTRTKSSGEVPISSRRNFRHDLAAHFATRKSMRGPYYDNEVVELQLPCFDPLYDGLRIPQPVQNPQLPTKDGKEIPIECRHCHEWYNKNALHDHLKVCTPFFADAVYCENCKKVFVNNKGYNEKHIPACCPETLEHRSGEKTCNHCKNPLVDIKSHLQTCEIFLAKQAGLKRDEKCRHCHKVPEDNTKAGRALHFQTCAEKKKKEAAAQAARNAAHPATPPHNAPMGPRASTIQRRSPRQNNSAFSSPARREGPHRAVQSAPSPAVTPKRSIRPEATDYNPQGPLPQLFGQGYGSLSPTGPHPIAPSYQSSQRGFGMTPRGNPPGHSQTPLVVSSYPTQLNTTQRGTPSGRGLGFSYHVPTSQGPMTPNGFQPAQHPHSPIAYPNQSNKTPSGTPPAHVQGFPQYAQVTSPSAPSYQSPTTPGMNMSAHHPGYPQNEQPQTQKNNENWGDGGHKVIPWT